MLFIDNYENADAIVIKLLKYLKIDIPSHDIAMELGKHPDYPSLLAISDVLQNFKVHNGAYKVETESLDQVPCPFVAHLNKNGGQFIMVNKVDADIVSCNTGNTAQKLIRKEFDNLFSGIVLVPETNNGSVEQQIKFIPSLATFRLPAIVAGLLIILSVALLFHSNYFVDLGWQKVLLTIFKTAGLIISMLLLTQSIDSNNPLIQKLCQSAGKSNCNTILTSKAANVFKGLTWSEVGFFYFAGSWLLLLFGGNSSLIWYAVVALNVLSLPYTVYSIYYQARVAKQWCVLCCTVQALLWLEFFAIVFSKKTNAFELHIIEISNLVLCLLLPVIFWIIIKPYLLKVNQLSPLKKQLHAFKYNVQIFNNMLKAQPRYVQPAQEWSIVLGNVEAGNIITMVTNPYCQPCAKTHMLLDEWLAQNPDVQARIVFTANNNDHDLKTQVSRHLMALNDLPDKEIVKHALHDWYAQKQKGYDAWAQHYPVQLNNTEFYKIDMQKAWCHMAEVNATPTLLLNGYRLPDMYQLTDLKYMLE